MPSDLFTVFLNGLEVYAFHGVSPAEQAVGHRYMFDIELTVAGRATTTDAIEDTVSYADVAALVERFARGSSIKTLERLAAMIADELMKLPKVREVEVRAAKPLPPMPHIAAEAGVIVRRSIVE